MIAPELFWTGSGALVLLALVLLALVLVGLVLVRSLIGWLRGFAVVELNQTQAGAITVRAEIRAPEPRPESWLRRWLLPEPKP